MSQLPADSVRSYYKASILGLRALEAKEGLSRRFGPDADARWARFKGKLHDGDRLQVLLRDASAPWGVAFAASHIFLLDGVADDEPFGPSWVVPNGSQARRYLEVAEPPTLTSCAALLGITPTPVQLPELRPTTQLVVAGGAAILAVASAFEGRADLDWARQVTVVADAPAHRQLAGLASVFIGAVKPCEVVVSDLAQLRVGDVAVVSPDAEPACAAALRP